MMNISPASGFFKLRFLCLRPLAPTAIALKGIYWQCVAAMGVGERVRERGQNRARVRPLSLTLSPIHLPLKSSRLSDLCRGKWMGERGRIARKAQLQSAPAKTTTPNRQPGFTLIEILIVIGLSSMVITTVALTLHLLQRMTYQIRSELPHSAAMMRLALRLRADAHDAMQFSTSSNSNGGDVARFTQFDEITIVYEAQSSNVVRRVFRNEQQIRQELFRMPEGTELGWSTDKDPPTVVTLLLKRDIGRIPHATDATHVDRIDAALGITAAVDK